MGGKKGVPSAKEKAAVKAKEQAGAAAQAREDADWAASGEGKKTKAQAKRGNKDEERQEAQAKKQEARRLAEEEAAELERTAKKATPSGTGKVTHFDLSKQRDAAARSAAEDALRREQEKRREVGEEEYARLVEARRDNCVDGVDARDVESAISQLGVGEEQPKMKFSHYHERELPALKKEKPGLKAPQYKDICWKKWLRSPENPLNQKAA